MQSLTQFKDKVKQGDTLTKPKEIGVELARYLLKERLSQDFYQIVLLIVQQLRTLERCSASYHKLWGLVRKYQRKFNRNFEMIPNAPEEMDVYIRKYLQEEHESKRKFLNECPQVDINAMIKKITDYDLILHNPQHVCCTRFLYKNMPVTHSGLSEAPILFLKEEDQLELAIAALINSKKGGTIFLGCALRKDRNGNQIPKIMDVSRNYMRRERRERIEDAATRIKDNLYPDDGHVKNKRQIRVRFITLMESLFQVPEPVALIPRITVDPGLSGFMGHLQQKENQKKFYHIYRTKELNLNMFGFEEVLKEQIYQMMEKKSQAEGKLNVHPVGKYCSEPRVIYFDEE